jgi:hypothetical protein
VWLGGAEVPNVSGLDGCGANADTAFIPVPTHGIMPPFLSQKQQQKWVQRRTSTDPHVAQAVAAVSEASLVSSVTDLQAYHTRNSYSETIYDAEAYLIDRLTHLGFAVETMQFRPDMVTYYVLLCYVMSIRCFVTFGVIIILISGIYYLRIEIL